MIHKSKLFIQHKNEISLAVLLACLVCLCSAFTGTFLKPGNIQQILTQSSELGLMVLGMSACIISGGFDLSIGAIVGLNSVITATMFRSGTFLPEILLTGLACCLLCGAVNGVLIGYFRMQPMVVTLGTSAVFTGIGTVLSKGHAISGLPEGFLIFNTGKVFGIPLQFWLLIFNIILFVFLFQKTRFGRGVYLTGSSYTVALFSGIPCKRCIAGVYVYSSFMAFIMSIIITSRLATGRIDFADNYVMQSVAAAVFGGISVFGGKGRIYGAVIAVFIFTVLSNIFNLLGLSRYLHQLITGVILLIVLGIRRNIEV